jgi:hypothetical protein
MFRASHTPTYQAPDAAARKRLVRRTRQAIGVQLHPCRHCLDTRVALVVGVATCQNVIGKGSQELALIEHRHSAEDCIGRRLAPSVSCALSAQYRRPRVRLFQQGEVRRFKLPDTDFPGRIAKEQVLLRSLCTRLQAIQPGLIRGLRGGRSSWQQSAFYR